ncbi:Ig-like domain-containing protein [Methanobrevibacter sp. DSM 116169]|uniref:Ig-like domain-containing protein n=1 Tax=Methanobrevibacter sp. DSM 116169 TaxID=3242727 RepID=UPI0038FC19D7
MNRNSKIAIIIILIVIIIGLALIVPSITNDDSKIATNLSTVSVNGIYGNNVELEAFLSDENGTGIPDKDLSLYVNGEKIATVKTDSKGNANYNYELKNAQDTSWYAEFKGDDKYSGSISQKDTINAHKKNTNINFEITGDEKVGSTLTLKSTLTDEGNPLEGKIVIFELNGQFIGTSKTNVNGEATFNYKIPNAGVYTFTSEFKGDSNYLANRAGHTTIYIVSDDDSSKKTTDIHLSTNGDNSVGSQIQIKAALTSEGKTVSGQEVTFYINGEKLGSSTTDSNGIATFDYNIPNAGVFTFSSTFKGNTEYSTSSGKAPTIYVVDNNSGNENGTY